MFEEDEFKVMVLDDGKEGGESPKTSDIVKVHYTGMFDDEVGDVFDSSRSRNRPFSFTLGVNQVIRCWDEGFKHLKKGQSG